MTSQKDYRIKREYEDLDEICGASTVNDFCHFRQQSCVFSSDTAIYLTPEKFGSSRLSEQITASSYATGSIPCFFRLGSNLPIVLLDGENMDIKPNRESTKQIKYNGKKNLWLVCYIFFYGFYLVIGALCFQFIETPELEKAQTEFNDIWNNFLEKYPQINESDLNSFLNTVISANNNGIEIATNSTSAWNFGDLLLFTTSMVTTIGYGHLSPITNAGKIFCIIYATIGIPLTLVLLSTAVEHLIRQTNKLLKLLIKKFGHLFQNLNIQLLHLVILAFTFLILFLIIPAVIFAYIESSWTGLDGFYFCFTSLTTIGLGDLVPDETNSKTYGSLYKTLTAIYLIIGLIAIMLVVTVFYTIPQLNIGVWLIESSSSEVNLNSTLSKNNLKQDRNKMSHKNLPEIRIDSESSSSKTLRTIV